MFLPLSIAALLLGPVVYTVGRRNRIVRQVLDGFIFITIAGIVTVHIIPEALAGGGLPIRRDLAIAALAAGVAHPLGLSLEAAAWGVHRVANATMARALRAVSTERGRDPRQLSILAFGGNGPVHAATLARLLDIRKILVPPLPGLFSALGMLFPQTEHHYVRTHKARLARLDSDALAAGYRALEAEGAAALAAEGFAADEQRFERLVDLRYAGANAELTLPLGSGDDLAGRLARAFADAHEDQFGYRSTEEPIETMCIRVIARATTAAPSVPERLSFPPDRQRAGSSRTVYFGPDFGFVDTPVGPRDVLTEQWRRGPLLVEEFDSTTVVPPDASVRRIGWDTIEIQLD